jgi:hypothetical protein
MHHNKVKQCCLKRNVYLSAHLIPELLVFSNEEGQEMREGRPDFLLPHTPLILRSSAIRTAAFSPIAMAVLYVFAPTFLGAMLQSAQQHA